MKNAQVSLVTSLKYLMVGCVFLISCSTSNPSHKMDKIKSISISTMGGQLGYYRTLRITPDTLYYEQGSHANPSHNKSIKKINTQYQLEEVIPANQLTNFSKIISGKSRQPVDGTDTIIVVSTDSTEMKITNAGNDELWQSVLVKINAIIEKEFKN